MKRRYYITPSHLDNMTVRKNGKVTGRGAVHRDRGYKIQHPSPPVAR